MTEIQGLPQNPAIGEVVVAVLGLRQLLAGARPITKEQREAMLRLPFTIRRETVRAISTDGDGAPTPTPFDFHDVNRLLAGAGAAQGKQLLKALPPDLGPVTGIVVARALDLLHQSLPRIARRTIASDQVDPGPPGAMNTFRKLWRVALHPGIVLEDLRANALSPDSIDAIETLYPGLYQLMLAAIPVGIAEIKAQRPRWRPSGAKERQIHLFMQSDVQGGIGDAMAAAYARARQHDQEEQGGGGGGDGKPLTNARRFATST